MGPKISNVFRNTFILTEEPGRGAERWIFLLAFSITFRLIYIGGTVPNMSLKVTLKFLSYFFRVLISSFLINIQFCATDFDFSLTAKKHL